MFKSPIEKYFSHIFFPYSNIFQWEIRAQISTKLSILYTFIGKYNFSYNSLLIHPYANTIFIYLTFNSNFILKKKSLIFLTPPLCGAWALFIMVDPPPGRGLWRWRPENYCLVKYFLSGLSGLLDVGQCLGWSFNNKCNPYWMGTSK